MIFLYEKINNLLGLDLSSYFTKMHAIINQTNPDIINIFGITPERSFFKKNKSEK